MQACEYGHPDCGRLRMLQDMTNDGLRLSFSLAFCLKHSDEKTEQGAAALIAAIAELTNTLSRVMTEEK